MEKRERGYYFFATFDTYTVYHYNYSWTVGIKKERVVERDVNVRWGATGHDKKKKRGNVSFRSLVKQLLQLKPIDSNRTVMFHVNLTRFSLSSFQSSLFSFLSPFRDYYSSSFFCFRSRPSKRESTLREYQNWHYWPTLASSLHSSPFIKIIDYKTVLHLMTWLLNWFTHSILFLSFSSLSHLLTRTSSIPSWSHKSKWERGDPRIRCTFQDETHSDEPLSHFILLLLPSLSNHFHSFCFLIHSSRHISYSYSLRRRQEERDTWWSMPVI